MLVLFHGKDTISPTFYPQELAPVQVDNTTKYQITFKLTDFLCLILFSQPDILRENTHFYDC